MKSHLRLRNMIFNTPHMVAVPMLDFVVNWADTALNLNIMRDETDVPQVDAAVRSDQRQNIVADTGIDIIPVSGILVSRDMHMEPCETMTSYETLRRQIQAAGADPQVSHIVLDIDSPGGSATGAFELADDIRQVALVKPITAISNFSAFSGAYLIAAACTEIVVSRTSGVGSIGVIARHADISAMNEAKGIKITTVSAGAHKNDLSPHEPISDQSLAVLTEMIQESYEQFVGAVAKFRGLSVDAVKATEAGVFFGEKGVALGLADRVETPQSAVNRIVQEVRAAKTPGIHRTIQHQAAAMALRDKV